MIAFFTKGKGERSLHWIPTPWGVVIQLHIKGKPDEMVQIELDRATLVNALRLCDLAARAAERPADVKLVEGIEHPAEKGGAS